MGNRYASSPVIRRRDGDASREEIQELFRESEEAVRDFLKDADATSPLTRAQHRRSEAREEESLVPSRLSNRGNRQP